MMPFFSLLAGVVIFLLGMQYMEEVLRHSAGRSLKLFLRRHTAHRYKAVAGGAMITALLQGSSTVNMMVLAFTAAGVFPLENALAIVLGSNLGTTVDSWLVATIGFSGTVQWLPHGLVGAAGIGVFLSRQDSQWISFFRFLLGVGMLLLGLDLMKSSMEGVFRHTLMANAAQLPVGVFLLAGIVITAAIQSSFATMALALSALYGGMMGMVQAAALVLGAEIGTTLKYFVASLGGHPVKKQLALGNFIINTVTALLLFFLLKPITQLIHHYLFNNNDLYALVFFQTTVNLVSLLLFFPFLRSFALRLEKKFTSAPAYTRYIHKIPPAETAFALPALQDEARHFLRQVMIFTLKSFDIPYAHLMEGEADKRMAALPPLQQYDDIKKLHGDIRHYYLQICSLLGDANAIEKADQWMSSVRNGMYAAKNIKDATGDIRVLRNSSNDIKYGYYQQSRERTRAFYQQMAVYVQSASDGNLYTLLMQTYDTMVQAYTEELAGLYRRAEPTPLSDTDISTLVNFNREMFTAYKSMVLAIKDALLDKPDAEKFDDLPGFIR